MGLVYSTAVVGHIQKALRYFEKLLDRGAGDYITMARGALRAISVDSAAPSIV